MRAADAMIPTPYVVRGVWSETHDVVSMELEPESEAALRAGDPGQFNMLWAFGVGEAPISISAGGDGVPLVHTIRRVGNVTRVLGDVQAGDAERYNHQQGSDGKNKPVDKGCFDGSAAAGAVKYYYGKSEHCKRDNDRSYDRACPDGRYQK